LKGDPAAGPIAVVSKPHAVPVVDSGTAKAAPAVQEPAAKTPNDFDQLVGSGEKKQGTEANASMQTALTPGPAPNGKREQVALTPGPLYDHLSQIGWSWQTD
jgi:hypothetical protein